ncbi:MAG TPA: hypothetical protein VNG12_03310 [Acidimicrobiales bacterium]|nr:hypothetical protein [Acidimicrobiales bacterium]
MARKIRLKSGLVLVSGVATLTGVMGASIGAAGQGLPPSPGLISVGPQLPVTISFDQSILTNLLATIMGVLTTALHPVTMLPPLLTPKPAPQPVAPPPTAAAPNAPSSVAAKQAGTLPDLTVTWVSSSSGTPATGAAVQLSQVVNGVDKYMTQITCGSCATTTFRGLTFGNTYQALVYPASAGTFGPAAQSPAVALSTSCAVGACVTVDGTSALRPVDHAAAGLLLSVYPTGDDPADVAALGVSMYRGAPSSSGNLIYDWTNWDVATAHGAKTTLDMGVLWWSYNSGSPPTPWSNWAAYTAWAKQAVKTVLASGRTVDYWEVYNEPGGNDNYYSSAGYASETPALLLQQFLVTYQAIKSVDPSAAIVGPSLSDWTDYPGQYAASSHEFDMVTFLNFAAANNLQLGALSWHEIDNNFGPVAEENTLYPAMIIDHVAQARALVAARPAVGQPLIFVNEFGMPEVQKVPGWDVAYLSDLTQAGVGSAGRSCWNQDCIKPDLDGLIPFDGTGTLPAYFDRLVYAAMSGTMLQTTSTSDGIASLGSFSATTNTLTGLIGRGIGCSQDVTDCPSSWQMSKQAAPTSVLVTVTVPWSSGAVNIALSRISGQLPELQSVAPTPVNSTAFIVPTGLHSGTISFSIPTFMDGDAYAVTITQ